MYLAKKQHQPRIQGIIKIRNLTKQLTDMQQTANQLKSSKNNSLNDIKKLNGELNDASAKIKVNF